MRIVDWLNNNRLALQTNKNADVLFLLLSDTRYPRYHIVYLLLFIELDCLPYLAKKNPQNFCKYTCNEFSKK